jgi:hypothetical protein
MKCWLLVFLFITTGCFSYVRAQSNVKALSIGKENLKGMRAIYVSAEDIDAHIGTADLTTTQILGDAQLRLRKAGIHVATREEWLSEDNIGDLNLGVVLLKLPDKLAGVDNSSRLVVYNIQVDLQEDVKVGRAPGKPIIATTYAVANQTGVIGANRLGNLRSTVGNSIDVFVKDYVAANPKVTRAPTLGPNASAVIPVASRLLKKWISVLNSTDGNNGNRWIVQSSLQSRPPAD